MKTVLGLVGTGRSRASSKASSDATHARSSSPSSSWAEGERTEEEDPGPGGSGCQGSGEASPRAGNLHKIWGGVDLSVLSSEQLHGIAVSYSSDSFPSYQSLPTNSSEDPTNSSQAAPEAAEADRRPAAPVSKGSVLHAQGTCKPCFFAFNKDGPRGDCKNGANCGFCHMPHDDAKIMRPCKSKRIRAKRQANELAGGCADVWELEKAASSLENKNESYLKAVLRSRAQRWIRADAQHPRDAREGAASSAAATAPTNLRRFILSI